MLTSIFKVCLEQISELLPLSISNAILQTSEQLSETVDNYIKWDPSTTYEILQIVGAHFEDANNVETNGSDGIRHRDFWSFVLFSDQLEDCELVLI